MEDRIAKALKRAGRSRSEVTLLAVSKKFSARAIEEAYDAGLRHFGENYVQEFAEKHLLLKNLANARFHLIGHLQSNKAKLATELFDAIETVDSAKLLERLNTAAGAANRVIDVLLELKLSDEENKTGAAPEQLAALLESAKPCTHLRVNGLMTIPPWSDDAELSRPYFQSVTRYAKQFGLPVVSMGMSNDFEVAIEEGATMIRVGTALFGPRPKPAKPA